ncbi:hypothetical protein [Microbacterium foliorum]|uniref:hypothetical protein n=1 Tax=Microbacterium foliorum TaxID=104336 RepID=UPI0028D3F3BB|nr:hypothetical protein [Microbacterium foliorum]
MTSDATRGLSGSIDLAWAAVEASGVPEQMRSAAFSEVLRSVLSPAPAPAPAQAATATLPDAKEANSKATTAADARASDLSEPEVLRLVSEGTGVSIVDLEQVIMVDDGVVKLHGVHTKFGDSTTKQARTVAQIVCVVRKLGMGASDTPYDIIKAACESKHCYDSKNFATVHLPKISGFVVKGEKSNRRLEAKGAGIAAFPALIETVLAA